MKEVHPTHQETMAKVVTSGIPVMEFGRAKAPMLSMVHRKLAVHSQAPRVPIRVKP